MKNLTRMIIVLLVISFVTGVSGCVDLGGTNETMNNSVFENQWVKFEYPSNLKVVDTSKDNIKDLSIYDGNTLIGNIYVKSMNKTKILKTYTDAQRINLTGREALSGNDESNLFTYIFLNNKTSETVNTTIFAIDFDGTYENAFNKVKETLIIKNVTV